MKAYLIAFFLLLNLILNAQNYELLDTADYVQRNILRAEIKESFDENKKKIKKEFKGKLRKEITASYDMIEAEFIKNINAKEIYLHPQFTAYITELAKEIINDNPEIKNKNIRVYLSRQNGPNAMSIGNGILLLNVGLFKYLANEAQIAAVLAHEIAHVELAHVKNSIVQSAKQETSKELRKRAKEIRKQKYNQYDSAFDVMKELLYVDMTQHREQESEADSLSYLILSKSKYPQSALLESLELMAKIDSLPNATLDIDMYEKMFDLPNQKFNPEWLEVEQFDAYNYDHYTEKLDEDSLMSHPEIVTRILRLKETFPSSKEKVDKPYDATKFEEIKAMAKYEDVANLNYLGKYGLSIYLSLIRLEEDSTNAYYQAWLGKNFKALYKAKKKYRFNRYVDTLTPKDQDESYQQFLSFLWNLNLTEIKNIADYYNQ